MVFGDQYVDTAVGVYRDTGKGLADVGEHMVRHLISMQPAELIRGTLLLSPSALSGWMPSVREVTQGTIGSP